MDRLRGLERALGSFDTSLIATAMGSISAGLAAIIVLAIHRRLEAKEQLVALAALADGAPATPKGPRHRFF